MDACLIVLFAPSVFLEMQTEPVCLPRVTFEWGMLFVLAKGFFKPVDRSVRAGELYPQLEGWRGR
jgi:hypothetical protein